MILFLKFKETHPAPEAAGVLLYNDHNNDLP
jgi:hypothetical protein